MSNNWVIFDYLIRVIQTTLLSFNLKKSSPRYKFFLDMVFGILKSGSPHLSDIAYSLNEDIALKKTHKRLNENILKPIGVDIKHAYLKKALIMMETKHYDFIVDDSDIMKPYGKKFEALGYVRDGSDKDNKRGSGYMLTSIVGITKNHYHPLPLYTFVHSASEKNYFSTNNITNRGLSYIFEHLSDHQATFVFDRGYDDQKLMNFINENKQYFIIRMRLNRTIRLNNKQVDIGIYSRRYKGKVVIPIAYQDSEVAIKASHIEGRITGYKDKISIIFAYFELESEPMILMSNHKIHKKEDIIKIVKKYINRWKIEEVFRFKKGELKLEDFRIKSLTSINNLMFLMDIAIFILALIIDRQDGLGLYSAVIQKSKVFKEDAVLKYYQIFSGVKTIFTRNKKGVKNYKKIERWSYEENNIFNSCKELNTKKRVRIKK